MPMLTEYGPRPEDVGEILAKVQEDLQGLKDKLLSQGDGAPVDVGALQTAINKTEEGIRRRTEQMIQQMNNRVMTLPSVDGSNTNSGGVSMETTFDLHKTNARAGSDRLSLMQSNRDIGIKPPPVTRKVPDQKIVDQRIQQVIGPTPGQMSKIQHNVKVISNPYNSKNREILNDSYGIQLPLIVDKNMQPSEKQIVMKGSTVEPLATLPRQNRVDPQLLPPPITENDAKRGILSLIERGLIPPAAELTLEPSPVRHKMAPLHDPQDKEKMRVPPVSEASFNTASVKLDPMSQKRDAHSPIQSKSGIPEKRHERGLRAHSGGRRTGSKAKTPVTMRTLEMALQPMPPPTTPASHADLKAQGHRFAIQNGRVRDNTQEYMAFKQHYCLSWGSIVTMLKHLEKMLGNYAVPVAFINGDRLADLSIEFELERAPAVQDLLSVIVNREDVESILKKPGRRYKGPNGDDVAACKIQATYRMYKQRIDYLDYRRRKWAAGVIALSWVMSVKMARVRKNLRGVRLDQLENFRRRGKAFAKNWDRIKTSRRVIIHIPSLGHSLGVRQHVHDMSILQNMQMGRLCDIADPNVDVIFISPVAVNEEMQQYYAKLLGLKTAIDSGNVEDQAELTDRYKIITPEAINSFPTHRMCLSTILRYSPRAMKRLQNLIRGREAYIVTGTPHIDDLAVADELNVPMLCPEPQIAHLYSTKSGSKRIFASANVTVPPGEYDVYSLPQMYECLAQLITENLEVTRWLFKLDDEMDGRGIAFIDVAEHLPCYPWAVKEANRYGEKWTKKWAQEAAYIKIHALIPEVLANHAQPVRTERFSNWEEYLEAFLSQGGIIEACPPSDSVTALTADMCIEPNGKISIVSLGDQIHAETQFSCWGMSVPQSSVEPEQLNTLCYSVGEACKARGVVGHFSIDFVTFIHPKTMQQDIWTVDLSLHYSDSLAMYRLTTFITSGRLDPATHYFNIPPPRKEEKKIRRKAKVKEEDEVAPNTGRYAVMSSKLYHTNLSVVHYSVFFQMCRAHGIGYDIKEKQGTVFTLVDSTNREHLGMVTVGDNLQGALATFARNLSVIHQEISAPNMQGTSNFKPVIEDVEAILGTTVQNSEEVEDGESQTSSQITMS